MGLAIGAGLAVGLAALGGGLGQGRSASAALEGIALLAANIGGQDAHFSDNKPLQEALLKASEDNDPRTRGVAAVAIGVLIMIRAMPGRAPS